VSIAEVSSRTGDAAGGPTDEQPLSEEERKMVTRLLADPIVFPQTFKTWLVAFLEGSDLTLPMQSILGLNSLLSPGSGGSVGIMSVLPAGLVFPFAGPTPPTGTLFCDGRLLSISNYQRLYKAVGTRYGGDGTTTFGIPDCQGRTLIGYGSGQLLGDNEHHNVLDRGAKHHHFVQIPVYDSSFVAAAETEAADLDEEETEWVVQGTRVPKGAAMPRAVVAYAEGDTSGAHDQDQGAFMVLPYVITY